MDKHEVRLLLRVLIAVVVILSLTVIPVFATQVIQYSIPLYVTNNSSTSYTYLPILATVNNTAMAANGFMGAQGLDAYGRRAGSAGRDGAHPAHAIAVVVTPAAR